MDGFWGDVMRGLPEDNHDLGLGIQVGSDSAKNQILEAQPELNDGFDDAWLDFFVEEDEQQPLPPSPSRLDTEWGYVLQKKNTNKRKKMDVKSSSTGVSSCSDVSEALSAISAALSLSSSASSGSREEQMIPDFLAYSEMLNSPTTFQEIQAASRFGVKGKANETKFAVPAVGMEFSSEDEVYKFYQTYAEATGFRVRKGKVHRSRSDNSIRRRYLFCSREGRKEDKSTKYKKKDTRTGCNARIECKRENGKWIIYQFFDRHNHPLERAKISQFHVVNREGKVATKSVGTSFVEVDKFKIQAYDEKVPDLNPEEVQQLISYFDHLQEGDTPLFSATQYDDDGKAKAIFWMDGGSKIDYKYFGDVLILDTTSKLDKHGVICVPFIGLNHHQQNVLFGCAFLLDETVNSLVWLLQTFAKAMGSVQPKTVLTNESLTMADAIKEVFPEAKHQVGFWHIRRNIASFSTPDFPSFFERCCFKCQSKEEFSSWWFQLLEGFDIHDDPRINALYKSSEKWAPVLNKKTFTGGIQDTASIDDAFQRLTREAKTLPMFVIEYLILAFQQRKKESLADFSCKMEKREFVLNSDMFEQQAANVYTHTMFKIFQKELAESLKLQIEEIYGNETAAKYMLKDGYRKYVVEFSCLDSTAICSCSKYETVGILCCHVLKVFRKRNVFNIPPHYILKRWSKFAKEDVVLNNMVIGKERAAPLSPNRAAWSFEMDFGFRTGGGSNGYTKGMEREGGRSRVSDENVLTRKKLRLSKQQSAVLEEIFKEHNTLGIEQELVLAERLNLRPKDVEVWFENRRSLHQTRKFSPMWLL